MFEFIKRTIGIKKAVIGVGYVVFMVVFWLAFNKHLSTPATAFFAMGGLTAVYYGIVKIVEKVLGV